MLAGMPNAQHPHMYKYYCLCLWRVHLLCLQGVAASCSQGRCTPAPIEKGQTEQLVLSERPQAECRALSPAFEAATAAIALYEGAVACSAGSAGSARA